MKNPKRARCLIFDYDTTWDEISVPHIARLLNTSQAKVKEWKKNGMTKQEADRYEKFSNAARNEAARFEDSKTPSNHSGKFTKDEVYRIQKFAEMLFRKKKELARREEEIEAEHRERQKLYLERLKNQ
jgi:hypothetical protein